MALHKVLIAYDGSDNAAHAITVAAELLGTRDGRIAADVVHAWEPIASAAARSAIYAVAYDDTAELVERERRHATELTERGVALAAAAGFDATGYARSVNGPLWASIVDAVTELDPQLVVMGTRGLTGLRSALSGSVSHLVTSHSPVPVLTIPLAPEPAGDAER